MSNLLHERLVNRRARLKRSQADVAKAAGIAKAQLSRYETGKQVPRPQILAKLAEALSVPLEWLQSGDTTDFDESTVPPGHVQLVFHVSDRDKAAIEAFALEMGLSTELAIAEIIKRTVLPAAEQDEREMERISKAVVARLIAEGWITKK